MNLADLQLSGNDESLDQVVEKLVIADVAEAFT